MFIFSYIFLVLPKNASKRRRKKNVRSSIQLHLQYEDKRNKRVDGSVQTASFPEAAVVSEMRGHRASTQQMKLTEHEVHNPFATGSMVKKYIL
ncbi:hypothetical protein XENTR_v10014862 [Xenopus tropicalis]|nr:hypothetical protein XENTR_v10014862 [Xenopus tropicalis]